MRAIVFVLWLLAAPLVFAQEDESARRVLDECVESLDAQDVDQDVAQHVGMVALEEQCPGLEQALVDLGLTPFISDAQWSTIGSYGLMDLQDMLDRYREAPEARAVQVDTLQSVLDELRQPVQAEQPLTWFQRFKRWLRDVLSKQESDSDPWLSRWLEDYRLSETARSVLFYGSVILIVVLALVVIVNEVRVARKGRRKKDRTKTPATAAGTHALLTDGVPDIDAAALSERPSIVLRMLLATLVKTGRLQAERSLTHRELITRVKLDDSSQRENFRRVAQLAERIVYGGNDAPADELDAVVQAGRALNAQLAGATS